jgi:hypothetical protein
MKEKNFLLGRIVEDAISRNERNYRAPERDYI